MTDGLARLLTGQSEAHVVPWGEEGRFIHREMEPGLRRLTEAAARDGIDLRVCSGFRSFERQCVIWNAKATGQRQLADEHGRPVDFTSLTTGEIITTILRWSALPGASRHHWGTDIDVFDAAAVPAGYELQLTTEESYAHFARLHAWLDENMAAFGFFRPYARDLGGIAPEAWHLSYAPVAQSYFQQYTFGVLETAVRGTELALKEQILENLPQIFERYFLRITAPAA